jgi:hypothetical protein
LDQYFAYSGDLDSLLRILSSAVTQVMTKRVRGAGYEDSTLADLARKMSQEQIVAAAKFLWDARTRMAHLDPRTGAEMIFVLLQDALSLQVPIPQTREVPTSKPSGVKLSLAAMVEKVDGTSAG